MNAENKQDAPAAGKGVDDAMVERVLAHRVSRGRTVGEYILEGGKAYWSPGTWHEGPRTVIRAALEAALTRQPVAGDGWIDRAARAAAEIGERLGQLTPQRDTGLELHHLKWMADELAAKRVGSETKCCRWLGWLQAGMVFHGLSTLEKEKQRNLRSAPTGPAQGDGEVEGG